MDDVENDNARSEWTVDVTDEDIRAAKREWNSALDEPYPDNDRVARLYADYRQLVIGQAQQIAEDFRARRVS